ncbi:unnamed protein product [Trichogramma brassicae]|uniref:Uncharacterized protein n=1 Tax=Trichogramma brassicae TaxID=86971 RepID=A0A6H5J280_9HYME|nr:unnamed protein product [Trichogramma brassicae]
MKASMALKSYKQVRYFSKGIYTLLVECPSIVTEHLRNHLIHLSSGKQLLRMALTTKCCLYAWQRIDDFSIDNHLIVSPSSYKGRPIGEANIQEYVSDVTSKYLPTGHSPWQVHVLNSGQPTRGSSSSFQQASSPPPQQQQQQQVCRFLVRVHHLLLRQEKLCLGDFLPLKPSQWPAATTDDEDAGPSSRLLMTNQTSGGGGQQQRLMLKPPNALPSPFANLYSEPQALPRLHQKLTESFSNVWNEFLCNNDPTERPEILKKRIGVWQCSKIAVIVCFSTAKEIKRSVGFSRLNLILKF